MDDKELELLEALKAQLKKENESIPQNDTTEEDELFKQLKLQLEEDNKKLKRALQTNKSTDTSDNDQDVGDENDKSSKGIVIRVEIRNSAFKRYLDLFRGYLPAYFFTTFALEKICSCRRRNAEIGKP